MATPLTLNLYVNGAPRDSDRRGRHRAVALRPSEPGRHAGRQIRLRCRAVRCLHWLQVRRAAGNNAIPTADEVTDFLSGINQTPPFVYLCRCGTHGGCQ
jgi:hypothetical protein